MRNYTLFYILPKYKKFKKKYDRFEKWSCSKKIAFLIVAIVLAVLLTLFLIIRNLFTFILWMLFVTFISVFFYRNSVKNIKFFEAEKDNYQQYLHAFYVFLLQEQLSNEQAIENLKKECELELNVGEQSKLFNYVFNFFSAAIALTFTLTVEILSNMKEVDNWALMNMVFLIIGLAFAGFVIFRLLLQQLLYPEEKWLRSLIGDLNYYQSFKSCLAHKC